MRYIVGSVCAALLVLSACGGGSGGGGPGDPGGFLTADLRGASGGLPMGGAPPAADPLAGAAEAAEDVRREIEEAELYRVEGDRLYLLNPWRGLAIVDLAGPAVVGRLALGAMPSEMFVRGPRALVVVEDLRGEARLLDLDVGDPAAPSLRGELPVGQAYQASRLADDLLYVVTATEVRSFHVGVSVAPVATAVLPHGAWHVHMADGLLVVASPEDLGTWVTLVDVSDGGGGIAVRGSRLLPGWVGDADKLHVGAGTLRVVTHDWGSGLLSRLFVIGLADPDLAPVLGSLELARGEQLFATRFTDELAYLVTFETVDPLWVIDLTNPSDPRVVGELTVPGWSVHLVPLPGRLVALGVDVESGWQLVVSLFDVSVPSAPALLDRKDLGGWWSPAMGDRRGFGVFPDEGLVMVPLSDYEDRVAVLGLGATTLSPRGSIPVSGQALRGFPHARGLCALSSEEVVLADPATLALTGRVTIAENVVDAVRLTSGDVLPLVARRAGGSLGDVDLPLHPSRCHPHGDVVAVLGWDDGGAAARVVDFRVAPPRVSERIDLGQGGNPTIGPGPDPATGMAPWGWFGVGAWDARMSPAGRLVVAIGTSGWAGGGGVAPPGGIGGTAPPHEGMDGAFPGPGGTGDRFVVIDVPGMAALAPVDVTGGHLTGFVLDGETLAWTVGSFAYADRDGRPWMRHELVRVDLATRARSAPTNVPGYLVRLAGDLAFTVEETWTDGWSYVLAAVVSRLGAGEAQVLDRRALPEGSYDLRAAGATLYATDGGAFMMGGPDEPVPGTVSGMPWFPSTTIHTMRLGKTLTLGPRIEVAEAFLSVLLAEEGAALLIRDGTIAERWEVGGPVALRTWEVGLGAWPIAARSDPTRAGYLLALGLGGLLEVP